MRRLALTLFLAACTLVSATADDTLFDPGERQPIPARQLMGIYNGTKQVGTIDCRVSPREGGHRVKMLVKLDLPGHINTELRLEAVLDERFRVCTASASERTLLFVPDGVRMRNGNSELRWDAGLYRCVFSGEDDRRGASHRSWTVNSSLPLPLHAFHFPLSGRLLQLPEGKDVQVRTIDVWTGQPGKVRYRRASKVARRIRGRSMLVTPVRVARADSKGPFSARTTLYLDSSTGLVLEARPSDLPLVFFGLTPLRRADKTMTD